MKRPRFHWFLPTHGDNRGILDTGPGRRSPTISYLGQIVLAAEHNGFESLLTAVGRGCDDPWLVTSALSRFGEKIKFLVALRPSLYHPTACAKMVQTFQNLSNDRLALNVVTGASEAEMRACGDFVDKSARYARTGEFLTVMKHEWEGGPYKYEGSFYKVEGLGLVKPLARPPMIYFGGASPAAEAVAARHADVHLFFGETPPMAAERISSQRRAAAELGRSLTFGIRLHVINRDTTEAAWAEAERLMDEIPDKMIERIQTKLNAAGAHGHKRVTAAHPGHKRDREALRIYPNMWAGSSLVYGSAALVGSHVEVAQLIREFNAIGIEHFILSGYPKLESCYWFGEHVLPMFRDMGAISASSLSSGGEGSIMPA